MCHEVGGPVEEGGAGSLSQPAQQQADKKTRLLQVELSTEYFDCVLISQLEVSFEEWSLMLLWVHIVKIGKVKVK